jgi:hypothetical protein
MPISTVSQKGLDAPLSLTAPNLGTPSAINLTNATALPKAALPTGSVLQVVNATYSTQTSSATATQIDTGLTASITPLFSTSKILIIANLSGVAHATNNTSVWAYLRRNTTQLYLMSLIAAANDANSGNNTTEVGSLSTTYLDSPATTSSTSYNCTFASQQGNATAYVQLYGATSSITLMEIAV